MSLIRQVEIIGPSGAFGDIQVEQLSPLFQYSFEYTVDNTDLITSTVVNGGTVTQADGMAVMTTSATTASSALLESKQHARYRSGLGGLFRFTVLFTAGVAGTEQYVGIMDEVGSSEAFKNGYGMGFNGTALSILRWRNDALVTNLAKASWDDPLDGSGASGITITETNLGVFAIAYQFLGAGNIFFLVENQETGMFVPFHQIEYSNLNTEPSVHNPNFHGMLWVNNGATTSNMIMKSSSFSYFVQGKTQFIELHQPINSSGEQQKTGVTTEVAIFTIRNKTTYASKTNFIDIMIQRAAGSIEASSANNLGQIRLVKNTTLGGTPSYSDINTANSVVEIDTAGTTVTGGIEIIPSPLAGKNDKISENITDYKIVLNPGETITVAGSSANSATINASALWRELF